MQITNLCDPGDDVMDLWRSPRLTLTPSVRPCPRQPHPPPSDFHQISPFHPTFSLVHPPVCRGPSPWGPPD
ncbi:hypothetical protein VZT92_017975 [Zoarces viviparus]|uniref:Uncharacterized protein n=1 Tax=Zoarces viviparus TaxID=48416 RepID=A0AAW1ES54_ZOAVI